MFNYKIIKTEKGISSLDIIPNKNKPIEVIDFTAPEKYLLDPIGTTFQKKVWKALRTIKRGEVKTYSDVAKMIKQPKAVRAVASAIARNNIAVLIPCHRVIRSDGTLGKYRWGEKLKRELLQNEGIQV